MPGVFGSLTVGGERKIGSLGLLPLAVAPVHHVVSDDPPLIPRTREAHDFLDAIRQDTRWNRIKRIVEEHGEDIASMPFTTIRAIAAKLLTDWVGSA